MIKNLISVISSLFPGSARAIDGHRTYLKPVYDALHLDLETCRFHQLCMVSWPTWERHENAFTASTLDAVRSMIAINDGSVREDFVAVCTARENGVELIVVYLDPHELWSNPELLAWSDVREADREEIARMKG